MSEYLHSNYSESITQPNDATYTHFVPPVEALEHPLRKDPQYLSWAVHQKDPTVEKYIQHLNNVANYYGGDLNDADLPSLAHKYSPLYHALLAKERDELKQKVDKTMSTLMLGGLGAYGFAAAPMLTTSIGAGLGAADYLDVGNVETSLWNPGWERTAAAYKDLKSGKVLDPTVFAGSVGRDILGVAGMAGPAISAYMLPEARLARAMNRNIKQGIQSGLYYHGSPNRNISMFKTGKDGGIYFTQSRDAAKLYTGTFGTGKVYNVDLNLGNKTITIDNGGAAWTRIPENTVAKAFNLTPLQVHDIIGSYNLGEVPWHYGFTEMFGYKPKNNYYAIDQVVKLGKDLGISSLIINNVKDSGKRLFSRTMPYDLTVVYNPRQIIFGGQTSNLNHYAPLPQMGKTTSTKTSLAFFERLPAKISKGERLGIPKGDRGNLSASQQEAVRDLHHYITDGKFKLRFLFDTETNLFFWGNAKPTPSTNAITTIAQHPQATIRLGDDGIGYMRIPTLYGTLTYFPHLKNTSHTISFPKSKINPQGFGEAAARAENLFGKSAILTSPKIDATDAGVVVEGLSSTVPKQQVHDFYKQLALTSKSGTYVTGDAAAYPLGHQAIVDYVGGNSTKAVATILSGETPTVAAASRTGLSPDSYISLLRSAQRPEWKLSFNRKLGFGKWNNSAVNNSDIYNAWQAARNGTLELKLAYIQLFNDWVAPYGGAKAYINDKGIIIHPHPFIVRQKSGGTIKIKKKNLGSFTRYCDGKVTEECIRKGKNSSNPTTRKRANFAWVARHKFKHEEGGKINYLNYFNYGK